MLMVKNKSGEDFRDRYNGQDYVFPDGEEVAVPPEVARHVFGYGLGDKQPALVRLGWLNANTQLTAAMEKLGQFEFRDADIYVMPAPPEDAQGQESGIPEVSGTGEGDASLGPVPPAAGRRRQAPQP